MQALAMIITCPNCQSRYEVAAQALGERGRKVECASCHANWRALPIPEPEAGNDDDQLFSPEQEDELDASFEEEEQKSPGSKPAPNDAEATENEVNEKAASRESSKHVDAKPGVDRARLARQREALQKRQNHLKRNLPQARLRRAFRMVMAVLLISMIGGGIFLRDTIVRDLPDLAGLYAAVGLTVNVVGIEFEDIQTVRAVREGTQVLKITANLVNTDHQNKTVPPVLVSLLDENEVTIYQWSVEPQVRIMQAGDWIEFSTQLTSPPEGATRLRLTFLERPLSNNN